MANKTDEVFAQAVQDLRLWLDYLTSKQIELREQMERARRKDENAAPSDSPDSVPQLKEEDIFAGLSSAAPALETPPSLPMDENEDSWL